MKYNTQKTYTQYILSTRVTLKLLAPPRRFEHWAKQKNFADSKVKREY